MAWTINGVDNELPNQTLTGTASILTRGLADSRYLPISGGSITSLAYFTGSGATGTDSVAMGYTSTASGTYSSAFGANTTATAYDSTVFGQYNVGGGSTSSWSAGDPLFEIGNGTSTTASDALLIYKNGNAVVQGTLTAGGTITAAAVTSTGTISTTGAVSAASLTASGTITASNINAAGVITAAPGGDIPMYSGH